MGWLAPLIGVGAGAIGGLFGMDDKEEYPDWYTDEMKYWAKRRRQQEELATKKYAGYIDPETGEYVKGSRERAQEGYEGILADPGYSAEEAAGLYYTPEEAESFRYTPEEMAALRITPEEEAGVISLSQSPVVGAMKRAEDTLNRAAAGRGNYYPGLTAATQRIQQEGGRQAAESALAAKLGITQLRRAGERDIAQQRIGAAGEVAGHRTGVQRDIGQTRLHGREFGTLGRERLSEQDLRATLGFTPNYGPPPSNVDDPWWKRAGRGATSGLMYGLGK